MNLYFLLAFFKINVILNLSNLFSLVFKKYTIANSCALYRGSSPSSEPFIDFEVIGNQIYSLGRSTYPTLHEWKTLHTQVQLQLALLSVTPGVLPAGFQNKLNILIDRVNVIYQE